MSVFDIETGADELDIAVSAAIGQRTDEWYAQRIGVITASRWGDVMSKGRGKDNLYGVSFDKYALEIAIERHYDMPAKTEFTTSQFERGKENEPKAIKAFQEDTGLVVEDVGFIKLKGFNSDVGGSPDGITFLEGERMTIEIKDRMHPSDHFYTALYGVPDKNYAQVQAQMVLTDCKRAFYITHCEVMDREHRIKYVIVERNEDFINEFFDRMIEFRLRVEAYVEKLKYLKNPIIIKDGKIETGE